MNNRNRAWLGMGLALVAGVAGAQAGKGPAQVVKPPVSQAWIDVATFSGFGMPGMGGGPGASPMSMMGGMFGGGQGAKNTFGNDADEVGRALGRRHALHQPQPVAGRGVAGRAGGHAARADAEAGRAEGRQAARRRPTTTRSSSTSTSGPRARCTCTGVAATRCGRASRACSTWRPRKPEEYGKFFVSRRATQRGAHSARGPAAVAERAGLAHGAAERLARRRARVHRAGRAGRLQVRHSARRRT